jgi:hypothetical protein
MEIDTETIPIEVYGEMLLQGAKVLLNRGQSKITKEAYKGNEDEMKAAAMAKAEATLADLKEGKVRLTGGKKKSGVAGPVMTEARRLAKNLVKDELKRQKIKIAHVEAKEITALANDILASDQGPGLIAKAEANLAEREATPILIDIKSKIKVSDKKVAQDAAKKAKDQLSKATAGKVAVRTKPAQLHS